jgi:hypothetical protein
VARSGFDQVRERELRGPLAGRRSSRTVVRVAQEGIVDEPTPRDPDEVERAGNDDRSVAVVDGAIERSFWLRHDLDLEACGRGSPTSGKIGRR